MRLHKKTLMLMLAAAIALTLLVVLVAMNLVTGEEKVEQQVERLYGTRDAQFMRVMGTLLGPPVAKGNRYRALRNGEQIFPAMLEAIGRAERSISFETYIFWSGDIGRRFADALAERARAGVKVHVMLDWVGSQKMDDALLEEMRKAGIEVRKYHRPHWSDLGRLNNRTHRKLLVIDGRLGYTGGVGIAPPWTGHAQDPEHWRDTHFELEGPAVAQMQAVFMDNWVKATGKVLHGPDYFPAIEPAGEGLAQVFSSSPSGGSESMQMMYLLSITAAERSIELSSSYFVPDELALRALVAARKRGVKVRIITPGPHIDAETVQKASRALWGPLLAAGAEIYEYQPTMFHCKVLVVDEFLVSAGSTNFDNRSFRLNDEANLNIYDAAFAREQVAIFEDDLTHSRRVSYEEWRERPWRERLMERLASLLGSQL
jgi:cardiolipin synthase